MRNIFIEQLIKNAELDKDIVFLTGDLGFNAFEGFAKKYPQRFYNIGDAEANMIGIAAGLALAGKKVFAYSIAPFITMRCYEQIRNNICQQNLNVKLIAVGGGFNYGIQGFSHNTIEDLAIMRVLPNMVVLCPGDKIEAKLALNEVFKYSGPVYLSLGKSSSKKIYSHQPKFKLGQGLLVRQGKDLTLVSIGNIIEDVLEVADKLKDKGFSVRVISMFCLKPFDKKIIIKAAKETKAIFTIEEYSLIGGLGSAVAENLLETNYSDIIFKRFAVPDRYCKRVGSQIYLRKINKLSVGYIVKNILKNINK
ncbi:MAG: transketolase C-terminal domain-containing protein, partial [Patescibacteria group bacterium]|nr:transketolase [Patescibacteria group bacterium]